MACGCEDATVQLFTQTDSKVRIVFPMYTAQSIKVGPHKPKTGMTNLNIKAHS